MVLTCKLRTRATSVPETVTTVPIGLFQVCGRDKVEAANRARCANVSRYLGKGMLLDINDLKPGYLICLLRYPRYQPNNPTGYRESQSSTQNLLLY